MIEETEIVLSNGDKCFIRIRFNDLVKQLVIEDVEIIPKEKRSRQSYNFQNDSTFMKLNNFEERYQYKLKKYLDHPSLTKEQLLESLNRTWESIKPVL